MKILLKVSGSISAYKVCSVASSLVKLGHTVKVAASRSSLEFVGATAWEGLSQNTVFLDDFTPGERMNHIHLNAWADVVVLAPASAQTLNAISQGVGSGVLTTLFLARDVGKPYMIFPAMNPKMWNSQSVQKSVETLKTQENVEIYEPNSGLMACGHKGVGRLKEPSQILDLVLKKGKKHQKSVLVTFGGTTEKIDGVRAITNFSSGRTGASLCEYLKKSFDVTAVGSKNALKSVDGLEGVGVISYESSKDLAKVLEKELKVNHYDLIVHAAAVSDFIPIAFGDKKISSDEDFELKFSKAPKILDSIREWSLNEDIKIVSFKLTHNQSAAVVLKKIKDQLKNNKSDFVVHNELEKIDLDSHAYTIWSSDDETPILKGVTKENMAKDIGGL